MTSYALTRLQNASQEGERRYEGGKVPRRSPLRLVDRVFDEVLVILERDVLVTGYRWSMFCVRKAFGQNRYDKEDEEELERRLAKIPGVSVERRQFTRRRKRRKINELWFVVKWPAAKT